MATSTLSSFLISFCFFIGTSEIISSDLSRIGGNSSRLKRESNNRVSCTLPPHPDNGRWTVLHGHGTPGDKVYIDTVVKFECDQDYKIISKSEYVVCDNNWSHSQMPECGRLCTPIYSTSTTKFRCVDKFGNDIKCNEATEGSYLSYSCIPFYEALGYKRNVLCSDGLWNYPVAKCQPVCGKKVNDDDTVALVFNGEKQTEIKYPWITAIYRKRENKLLNICGGSMISLRVVITAAHCVTNGYGDIQPKGEYKVAAGKLYLQYDDPLDIHIQSSELHRIVVHPGYKGEIRHYIADIALLITKKPFKLSEFVQPVCYTDLPNIHLHAGNLGEIAGWGINEDGIQSNQLRALKIPYKYETTCSQELPEEWANKYDMFDKMCAGFFNKNMSVCRGDSGSGLVFRNSEDRRFYIHGIVSIAPGTDGDCNFQQNSLYTKVSFYYEFVDKEINKYNKNECRLPPYPANGKWTIENKNRNPGEIVTPDTVLKLTCNEGYKLSSDISTLECSAAFNIPTCQMKCPTPEVLDAIGVHCRDKYGKRINCYDAAEGSSLSYTCASELNKNTKYCSHGSWGTPQPSCLTNIVTSTTSATISASTTKGNKDKKSPKVVCKYEGLSAYSGIYPEDFNASLCTHVIYAYIGLWNDGNVRVQDDPLELDSGEKKGLYRRVTALKKKNKDLVVLLGVGGTKASNQSLFSIMAADSSKRPAFIYSAVYFMNTYNFDGLDIDWYLPDGGGQGIYINLLKETRKKFDEDGYLLTVTVPNDPGVIGDVGKQLNEVVDWIHVKTYDMYGSWSPYTGQNSALRPSSLENDWEKQHLNVEAAAKNWLNAGISKSKLALTVAFFGKSFTLKDKNQHGLHAPITGVGPGAEGGVVKYSEICRNYSHWTGVWDDEQKTPYRYLEDKWIGFNDKDACWAKAVVIKQMGIFGLVVFPLDGDDVHGNCGMKQILLKHVHGGLGNDVNWNS